MSRIEHLFITFKLPLTLHDIQITTYLFTYLLIYHLLIYLPLTYLLLYDEHQGQETVIVISSCNRERDCLVIRVCLFKIFDVHSRSSSVRRH